MLVAAIVVNSLPIPFILMMEALLSSESLVLKKALRRNIPKHAILQ
jgi:hypothetical protein